MITLCIDESGNFEDKGSDIKFIGGLIYNGEDVKEEEKRLDALFKRACIELNIKYPQQIHTTVLKDCDLAQKRIKEKLRDELIDYINKSGKYNFVFLIKGENGRTYNCGMSNLTDENFASNLYDNMVANLAQNVLFYNPYLPEERFYLIIASRISYVNKNDVLRIMQYKELGYSSKEDKDGNLIFFLNNSPSVKAAISSKIIENNINKNIDIKKIEVKKIDYENKTDAFLYAADIACNIIKTQILKELKRNSGRNSSRNRNFNTIYSNGQNSDFSIAECCNSLNRLSGTKVFAWAYDDIENLWKELNLSIYKGDFLLAIDNLYEIYNCNSPFQDFYKTYWCSGLENNIKSIFREEEMGLYLSKIESLCFAKEKSYYEKGLFLASIIKKFLNESNFKRKEEHIFKLNDLLLRGYNHRGDTKEAYLAAEECRKRKDRVGIMEYLSFLNRELEIYVNEFDYDECIKKAEDLQTCINFYKEMEQNICYILDKEAVGNILRGKILSSLGQFCSFKGDKQKAVKCFEDALEEMAASDRDRKVTLSYLLHLAVDTKDIELYEKYSKNYWNYDRPAEIFDYIISKSRDRFEMFLFLKAIDAFYIDNLSNEFLRKIIYTDYKALGFNFGHPWELIHKYMAILALKKGMIDESKKIIPKIEEVEGKAETIELINCYSYIQYYTLLKSTLQQGNNLKTYNAKMEEIESQIEKASSKLAGILNEYPRIKKNFENCLQDGGKIDLEKLQEIFTYMYR